MCKLLRNIVTIFIYIAIILIVCVAIVFVLFVLGKKYIWKKADKANYGALIVYICSLGMYMRIESNDIVIINIMY